MLLEVKCIIIFNTNMNLFLFLFFANKQIANPMINSIPIHRKFSIVEENVQIVEKSLNCIYIYIYHKK